jgi:tRNA threonylcarbamoyladenosine biosynthesis protein TsaB
MNPPLSALALETSGRIGSVALVVDGSVISHQQFPHGLQHAARILPVIDSLCRDAGLKPRDLREIYISIGPGSFTGLRIGLTVAKTIALATGAKLVPVPTVDVLAHNAPPEAKHLIIVLDAKRGQIFTARFERQNNDWLPREPAHLDTLSAMLSRSPRPVHLLGEGLPYHQQSLDPTDKQIISTPPESWQAHATIVAKLGWTLARANHFADPTTLIPLYVRLPEAQEKFDAAIASQAPIPKIPILEI